MNQGFNLKLVLWQCSGCKTVMWAGPDSAPLCDLCQSYQTVKVAANGGRNPPPAFEAPSRQ